MHPASGLSPHSAEALLAPRLEQRIVPGLDRIRTVLAQLGNPERDVPVVLIVGTNGKGSTAALLASMLSAHGLRIGLYTSPHLVRVEERIQIDGVRIPSARLSELLRNLERFPELSYFETLTVAAFQYFAGAAIDLTVLEAGLGGRWDATNAADPVVALLTNVGTDHQQWLGTTRTQIAAEKAAALRGREAIIGVWDGEVEGVIRAAAAPTTPISLASQWAAVRVGRGPWAVGRTPSRPETGLAEPRTPDPGPLRLTGTPVTFEVTGVSGSALLPLQGEHQLANLELALAGAAALAHHGIVPPLKGAALTRGIEATHWPGRLQWLNHGGRRLLLDGAHNREAVVALTHSLDALGLSGSLHLLFSCLSDKPLAEMAALLRPRAHDVTIVQLDSPRATDSTALASVFPDAHSVATVAEALASLPTDRPTLVTGSLRLVGEVLRLLDEDHD